MGSYVSAGKNNDELVDNLVEAEFIKTPVIQRVFRAVDRGNYCAPDDGQNAYKDIASKVGNLHISAPCVYSIVMEALKLKPGLTFLNLGSGTGYLSTMVGLVLGPYGVNHGVELYSDVLDYAYEKLNEFVNNSSAIDEFDFCEPTFELGNCLWLDNNCQQYDRVYCGASCPPEYELHLKNLIKIGGILVMPLREKLLKVTRTGQDTWHTLKILSVSFTPLVVPKAPVEPSSQLLLSDINPPKLKSLCRSTIRDILKKNIDVEKPNIAATISQKERKPLRQVRRIIIPFIDESSDSSELDYDSDTPEYRISTQLPTRMSAFLEEFIRRHGPTNQISTTNSATQAGECNHSSDDEIYSLFTVTNVRQPANQLPADDEMSDYDQPPSASTRSKKKRKREKLSESNDASSSSDQKLKVRHTAATVYWKKHKSEKRKEKEEAEVGEETYTTAMVQRIGALPLPSSLLRYLNYKRDNL